MSHRVGICSTCEANYKVPADFATDKAKCKECGGVVEIGAVVEDPSPPPVPAKPVRRAESKMEEHVPSGKKGGGPSMMEKLRAKREAEQSTQEAAEAPAAKTTAPETPKTPTKKAASDAGPPKAKAGPRKATPTRPSRRRRGGDDEGDEDEETTERRTRGRKKKSPVPLICTLLLVVVGGGAGVYFMLGDDDSGEDMEDTAKVDVDETAVEESTDPEPEEVIEETVEAPAEEPVEEEKPKPASNPKVKDPMEIDLAALEDFGQAPGCDDTRWATIQEDAALLVDPLAGAAGGRAGKRLEAAGRLAVPALINVFKTRDMGTDAGFRDGDVLQRALQKIYNSKNFGWKYTTEPNDHWYNRRVVELWWKNWEKYQGDEAGWLKFTGLDKEAATPSDSGEDELSTDELDALDDI